MTGKVKIYYENGNIWYEGELKGGIPHGKGITYDKIGILIYEGNHMNGKPSGDI